MDTPTREHWQTVLDNTGLVWFHLNRRRMTGDEREAAYADGCLGLLRAAQKFDPDKGFTFGTYAMWWIRESVSRGIAARKTLNARYAASKGEAYRPPVSLDTAPVGGGENENLVFSDIIADPRVDVAGQNEVSERLDMVVAAMTVGARDSVDLAIIEALGDKPGWHASIASRFGISGGTVRRRAGRLRQYAIAADAGLGIVPQTSRELDIASGSRNDAGMEDRVLASAFGEHLRRLRLRRSMSQDDLAQRAGISRTSVVNIEAGRQGVALATLYRLAEALGASPGDLLPELAEVGETPAIAIGPETDDSSRLIRRVMRDLESGGVRSDN